jgi:UDP-N-acetylglucosamine acyltransferase
LNLIGLRRHNVPKESIGLLDDAFRILFSSGLSVKHALDKLAKEIKLTSEVAYLVEFIKKTERGIARSCRK